MPDAIPAPSVLTDRLYPPAIALREIWPYALLAVVLLVQLYFVGADQGATSLVRGSFVHELVHDGRHLLGFPSH
jgi:hypothetical protein